MSRERERLIVFVAIVFGYFVSFPEDVALVISPAREILALTEAISPWFYLAFTGCAVGWMVVRCFGRRIDFPPK